MINKEVTRKEQLINVFEDTQRFYTEDKTLAAAVEYGRKNTKLYEADDYPELPDPGAPNDPVQHLQQIRVSKNKTFEAAMKLHQEFPDKKIAVLNFASAIRPGGGVKGGSTAQEESLCRCSTLYPTIDRRWLWQKYYDVNRAAQDVLHTDACIYSPGVIICKTDESIPKRMTPSDFVTVDVISCAAPNLSREPANYHNPETGKPVRMEPGQLRDIHMKRARHIMHVAAANKVDILILGAFGCGAFANDPAIVAQAYCMVIREYQARFDVIEFAIYCKDHETDNYKAFYERIKMLKTERLNLRRWKESDAEDLYKYASDPDVGPIAGWPPHQSVDESLDVIRNVLNGKEAYAICLKEDGKAIGSIELKLNGHTDMTDRDDECEMGYWLGKPFWGQGIMPEAVKEMLRHAFEDCGMQKVWIGYYEGNHKSKRVQEKCGFKYQWRSENVDVPLMHEKRIGHVSLMTREDWEAIK